MPRRYTSVTPVQVLLLLAIAHSLLRAVQRVPQGRVRSMEPFAPALLWIASKLSVLLPEPAHELSQAFGVTRRGDAQAGR